MNESESRIQSLIRLEIAKRGGRIWRNNNGAAFTPDGRPVRYGLGNDSANLNKVLKSSDLIGWMPTIITPADIGKTFARFLSIECKKAGWVYAGTDREHAQLNWINLVKLGGGLGGFVTNIKDLPL